VHNRNRWKPGKLDEIGPFIRRPRAVSRALIAIAHRSVLRT
jgi:hypothetical protein